MKKLSTTKAVKHNLCVYSMSTLWPFDSIEYKYDVYRGVDYTNKLMIKAIIKLMVIVITLVNTAVMHIAYEI